MYPIEVTQADLQNYGITFEGKSTVEIDRFITLIHQTLYEMVLFVTFRNWRTAVIEKYKSELEPQIKAILCNIAFETVNSGNFKGLFDGTTKTDGGAYDMKSTQDKFQNALTPLVWNQIMSLEPSLTFCGGEV